MDILLNDEEELIRSTFRDFLEQESPISLVKQIEASDAGYSADLWSKCAELGWLGMGLPERFGGSSAPLSQLGLIFEECGRALAPLPLLSTLVTALIVAEHGTPAQQQQLLPGVVSGDVILTWATTDTQSALSPENIELEGRATAGGYILRGRKLFVENFDIAGTCLIAARTGSSPEAVSLFLIDTQAPEIRSSRISNLAGDHQFHVELDGLPVGADALVGEAGGGWPLIQQLHDLATAFMCSQIEGATRRAVEMAVDYAKDRVAFGRPIGGFQAIQHYCADMVMWVDGSQLLTREALWRMDHQLPATLNVSCAKSFTNVRCVQALRNANQIHGGLAQMKEFSLQQWYRRATAWCMRLGTTFDHRKTISHELGLEAARAQPVGLPV